MDGPKAQRKIWHGYAQAAKRLGTDYTFYRIGTPDQSAYDQSGVNWDTGNWDQPGNLLLTRKVSLNAEDMNYGRPNKYGKATWYALVDGTDLAVGDYFLGQAGTFFIAAMQLILPILVVECNRVVSLFRPQQQVGTGPAGYGGTTKRNQILLAQNRPCSILQGTKGEKSDAALPGDTRSPWWTILLPAGGMNIMADDIITDDLGRRYIVSSPELSQYGWRLTAMMAVP